MRFLVVVVIAACAAPAAKPDVVANTARPLGPTPLVERGGRYGLTAKHMPAIAADGSRIVAAVRESDGERGFPNLTLVIKDRRDAELDRHVVLSLAEADTMLDDADGNNPELDARVTRANTWLAELGFEAMPAIETVTWEMSHLRIIDGARVVVDMQTPPSWLPETVEVGTNVCQRAARLGGVAIARVQKLAVVTISYTAESDFCLAPPDQHHVIVW